jgi:hypothetical protein
VDEITKAMQGLDLTDDDSEEDSGSESEAKTMRETKEEEKATSRFGVEEIIVVIKTEVSAGEAQARCTTADQLAADDAREGVEGNKSNKKKAKNNRSSAPKFNTTATTTVPAPPSTLSPSAPSQMTPTAPPPTPHLRTTTPCSQP